VSLAATLLRALVRLYQLTLAGVLPPSCRFEPSCSHYAMEALRQHGAMRGTVLTVRRLLRCNPWGGMGYDPVPAPRDGRASGDGRTRPSTVLRF